MKPSFRSSFGRLLQLHHFDICVLLETRLSGPSLQQFRRRVSRSWSSYAIEANGLSGGILALWRNSAFQVEAFHQNNQQVGLIISGETISPWLLLGVYASTDFRQRRDLWAEIITLLGQDLPTLVAGDFNCILNASEKRGGRRFVDSPNSREFRSFISMAGLLDMGFSGQQFTWCNNRSGSARVWERLDRVLASSSWLQSFTGATATHLPRIASDHCPLLISTEVSSPRKGPFRFEQFWTHHASTRSLINQVWHMPIRGSPSYRLSRRLELTKRRLLRWHRTEFGDLWQRIQAAECDIATLQTKEDTEGHLSESDLQALRHSLSLHHSLLRQQETYWWQRSRVQWIQDGDRNTKFFHQATVARRAANRIRRISDEDGNICEDDRAIRDHLLNFFRSRWSESSASANPNITPILDTRVSEVDNQRLCREVLAEEIRAAVWALGPDKAPGPDGFSPFFFRFYWDIVGQEVILAIQSVFASRAIPSDWQQTFLALIPKKKNALLPQHYRPISLCTTLYKVCARILVTRLQGVIPRLISPEQGAFIRGRSITDNVFIAQEFMHDLQHATVRQSLMAIQLDMERAYDRMSWTFLRHTLQEFGFAALFIDWIMACVQGPSFSIIINGCPTEFFTSVVGLRQGCPLSPFLFILCADDLSRALRQAVGSSRLLPYMPGSSGPPLTHLLFADDCVILSPASVQNAATGSAVIQSYCSASGQKVNLQKSLLCFSPSTSRRCRDAISQVLGISTFADRLSYLGIPISGRRPRMQDFGDLDRRITARLERWQVSGLSMMGRITLLRSVLSSLPLYLLSNTLIPITCLRRIERRFRDFLWASMQGSHGVHLLAWDTVCLPVSEGGLGIQSLVIRREALMARHASRFLLDPDCLWSSVMRSRYGGWTTHMALSPPRGCSFLWRAICQAAPTIMSDIHWMIGDGTSIDIIQDTWVADIPLSRWPTFISADVAPSQIVSSLICQESAVWNTAEVSRLFGHELASRILSMPLPLSAGPDTRLWRRSCLPHVPMRDLVGRFRPRTTQGRDDVDWIWRLPVHPRVQLFLWKISWDRLPTCSLLADRGLAISPLCPVCGMQIELVDHAIFMCHRASLIWQLTSFTPWLRENGSTCTSFLQAVHRATKRGPRFQGILSAYLAYHIWLSRNRIVFAEETALPQVILRRAFCHAREYTCHHLGIHSNEPGPWDSPAASAANRSTVFISWEPPPPGYVKVNFDGSVSDRSAGSGFVIRGEAGQLLAAGGYRSTDISVPLAELQAAWAGITHAVHQLGYHRLIIEGDSLTVIRWISQEKDPLSIQHPLLRDIRAALLSTQASVIRHVYREANAAADWVATTAARRSREWTWDSSDSCPSIFQYIMYSDIMGLTRARVV